MCESWTKTEMQNLEKHPITRFLRQIEGGERRIVRQFRSLQAISAITKRLYWLMVIRPPKHLEVKIKYEVMNMTNMSYCRFENTARDLRDCVDNWEEIYEDTSSSEKEGKQTIIELAREIVEMEGD